MEEAMKLVHFFPPKNKMSSSPFLSFLFITALILRTPAAVPVHPPLTITIFNNCPFPVWPAIQPIDALHPVLQHGGFALPSLSHRSFPAPPTPWSGRIWGRTRCVSSLGGRFSCATGDCGGRLQCNGLAGGAPATLAQLDLGAGFSAYGVSLADGFNLPMTVTPHEGKGPCPVVGCKGDLLATCPPALQVRSPPPRALVVGCKSGCAAPREIKIIFCQDNY